MYICIHVYIYMYMYIYTYIHMYISVYTYTHLQTCSTTNTSKKSKATYNLPNTTNTTHKTCQKSGKPYKNSSTSYRNTIKKSSFASASEVKVKDKVPCIVLNLPLVTMSLCMQKARERKRVRGRWA